MRTFLPIRIRIPGITARAAAAMAASTVLALSSSAALGAVDGCQVMLCLAAPKWQDIPMCVPTIRTLLHDLARGRPFPICGMGGSSDARHDWSAVGFCPPQYSHLNTAYDPPVEECDYSGAVSVLIDHQLFTRTWWSMLGNTVTEYTPEAKAKLGTWDTRFDDDYAAWKAAQPVIDPNAPVTVTY